MLLTGDLLMMCIWKTAKVKQSVLSIFKKEMETLLQFSYLMTLDVMILRLKYKAVKHGGKRIRVSM